MVDLKKHITVVSIINLTGKIMRDIILTYDGDNNPIEILKIKNDYEKVVFLHRNENNNEDLFNLTLLYGGIKYIVYKNIDINSNIDIKLKITEAEDEKIDIKSYLYIA
ncbi:MAG: hypothetical protein ACRDCW_10055 [Sarcina sp.]